MTTITFGAGVVLRGLQGAENPSATTEPQPSVAVPAATNRTSYADAVLTTSVAAHTQSTYRVIAVDSTLEAGHYFEAQTPYFDVAADGTITAGPGATLPAACVVHMHTSHGTVYVRTPSVVSATGRVEVATGVEYLPGTLGAHITESLFSMIRNKVAGNATQNRFLSNNHSVVAPAAVRNPYLFTGDLDLTAISIARTSEPGGQYPIALVGPRIAMSADHTRPGPGEKFVFMDLAGGMHVHTVQSSMSIGGDIGLVYLTAPVTGITPFKFLPANLGSYIPSGMNAGPFRYFYALPCLFKGAHTVEDATGDDVRIVGLGYLESWFGGGPVDSTFTPWYHHVIGGDSSGPYMLPVQGVAALGAMAYAADTSAPYHTHIAEIEAGFTTLAGSPQTVGITDCSRFPTF